MAPNGILNKLNLTRYCTEQDFLDYISMGCPHCSSKEFNEGTHPELGGLLSNVSDAVMTQEASDFMLLDNLTLSVVRDTGLPTNFELVCIRNKSPSVPIRF
jgi:predicted aconitase